MQNIPTNTKNVRVTVRIPESLRDNATDVANDLGIDLNNAIKLFLTQMVKDNALPFQPSNTHPSELELALADVKAGRTQRFNSLNDLMQHIDKLEAEAHAE